MKNTSPKSIEELQKEIKEFIQTQPHPNQMKEEDRDKLWELLNELTTHFPLIKDQNR